MTLWLRFDIIEYLAKSLLLIALHRRASLDNRSGGLCD